VSFSSKLRFNTRTLEDVTLQFHSAVVEWMRIRCEVIRQAFGETRTFFL